MLELTIDNDEDVVRSRMTARQVAAQVGFAHADQARIATAVSEVARNALGHGGGGKLRFDLDRNHWRPSLVIDVSDNGPGIADLQVVLEGQRGGQGLISARRLMDDFNIDSSPSGTTVSLRKFIPPETLPATLELSSPQKSRR
ncbi:MAG TPA: ATP-binding protein, partial [Burkholderiales bacterium]|nr:ATP-binding protein [Burkholderiales bacterium]